MIKSLLFHREAEEEIESARDWYAQQSLVAARAFLKEIETSVEQVMKAPEMWPLYEDDIRRYVFRRFPYSLLYRVESSRILVLAVAHAKRRPGYWRERK